MEVKNSISKFVEYTQSLEGDEKGEAQVFLDRFFQAFSHQGYKEAGAKLEHRVRRKDKATAFADLVWAPRLLLEMKKRGANLHRHYDQMRDYWYDVYPKPKYAILCNFDEFWIYDFFTQSEPVDKILVEDLTRRYTALNFMFPEEKKPLFKNDMEFVSRAAASKVADVFNSLVRRDEDRFVAQRFILQCVFSMFAEDFDLLPRGLFTELVDECKEGSSSYDLFGALFKQMNNPKMARGGRFKNVDYFDGGLFAQIDSIDLTNNELNLLAEAASEDWSKVQPPIFGALFEGSMGKEDRHALGAHFTYEADIKKIVRPTIEIPWKELIEKAKTLKELIDLRQQMTEFKVLDPACGCGNFLYVAFRELRRLEMLLLQKVHDNFKAKARQKVGISSRLKLNQFYGIDISLFAVELAKVTMMLAKEQSIKETKELFTKGQYAMEIDFEKALPLDNLDNNIICDDALFCQWPRVEAIIGNPPYQSKNKMQQEFGPAYVNKVREKYKDVPGHADYCVYWFRRAHDELDTNKRAGLVGTNTIRQTYSRKGGLDYIVKNDGTIVEAVSSQPWSGDAVVHVSIVNWIKGEHRGPKVIIEEIGQKGKTTLTKDEVDHINSSLSAKIDVSEAKSLEINACSDACYQGQTHGHKSFLLSPEEAGEMFVASNMNREIVFPYLIADELLRTNPPAPQRFVIDFHPCDMLKAAKYKKPYERVKFNVLPTRQEAADKEAKRNEEALKENPKARTNRHHANFLRRWWLLSYPREELINKIVTTNRYIVCGQVTKRPIFEFVSSEIRPNAALIVFPLEDDYSFGILQSNIHWLWFKARCSTLKEDYRYTSNTVFDSFPWPQSPNFSDVKRVAEASVALREFRKEIMQQNGWSLRELYRNLETPGDNPLRDMHIALDNAVMKAYGMKKNADPLNFLFSLNHKLAESELKEKEIVGPGLPPCVTNPKQFITEDSVGVLGS